MLPPQFFNPLQVFRRKLERRLFGRITLRPKHPGDKRALLSYVTHPFALTLAELNRSPHTNPWECLIIAELLLERGFVVDVIEWTNTTFIPKQPYDLLIDVHHNLERLAPKMGSSCIKVFYATGAYWRYQNQAELSRLQALKERRGVSLAPQRQIAPEEPMQYADYATALGSAFSADTYPEKKPSTLIPLLSTTEFPSPKEKNFAAISKNFAYIGGGGAVHKGLDLVLEAFAQLPDYTLTICAPLGAEQDFMQAYAKELTLPNIKAVGRIDVRGEEFKRIIQNAVALVYPTCSEGQAGSVITGLHAGLIPIVTRQSGVEVSPFGLTLSDNPTVAEVRSAVTSLAALAPDELCSRAVAAWGYAREHHTKAKYRESYAAFLDSILKK